MRALLLAPLAVVLALSLPSAAGAAIVPQEGIKGLKLGMTVADVRGVLGKPDRFRVVRSEVAGRLREWRYGLTRVTFDGTAADAKVLSLDTRSRTERTAEGVGVGSRKATVKRKVSDVRCLVEFSYDHCFVGAWRPGEIVTDFAIDRRGRVARVTVGRVVD
jgi:hypothetical protein